MINERNHLHGTIRSLGERMESFTPGLLPSAAATLSVNPDRFSQEPH